MELLLALSVVVTPCSLARKVKKEIRKIEWKDPKKKNDQKEKEKRKLFNS